jgi:hypothetical protein
MPANPRPVRRPRLGLDVLEDRSTPTVSAISANFNSTPIPAGDTVWFSSVGKVSGLAAGTTTSMHLTGGTVSFTAGGTAYTVDVPDTTITFTPLATKATTTYSASGWLVTAPLKFNGNVFLGGAALPVVAGLPGGIKNVTWQTDVTADAPRVSVSWKWGAAVYSSFGSPGAVGAKAVDDAKVDFYRNSDAAGTPENFKAFVVRGGTGTGGNSYTGGYSGSKSVAAGAYVPPPAFGSLSGTVFQDNNGDHLIDPSDLGYEGVEVDLLDANGALVTSTLAAADGTYSFAGLAAGTYQVEMVVPDPIFNTMLPQVGTSGGTVDPSWALVTDIALGSGATATGYNFGVWVSGA